MRRTRAPILILIVLVCLVPPAQSAAQQEVQHETIPALGFEDADVKSVLALISDFGNVNIVPDGMVTGRVTLQLRQVNWIDALEAIMTQQDLVSIPTTESLRGGISDSLHFIQIVRRTDFNTRMQQELQNQQEILTSEPLQTKIISLSHSQVQEIQVAIATLSSPDGIITADTRTNSLILRDYPKSLELIEQVVEQLDIPVPQIRIEVKLLEVDTDRIHQLGFSWDLNTGGTNPLILTGSTDLSPSNTLQTVLGISSGTLTLDATISALENQGVANMVARPSISVLDNIQGLIFMGEKVPLRELDVAGNVTINLRDIGIGLEVTPHVVEDDWIILDLVPTRESFRVDPSAGIIVSTQNAATTVKVRDGETAVIGGLKSETIQEADTGIPILMNIPFIGALFRYHSRQVQVRDLIIFVTPRIERESAVILP
ncbi:secretin N-terminal domain-containing protein [Gemmatimonadota bacterium]